MAKRCLQDNNDEFNFNGQCFMAIRYVPYLKSNSSYIRTYKECWLAHWNRSLIAFSPDGFIVLFISSFHFKFRIKRRRLINSLHDILNSV